MKTKMKMLLCFLLAATQCAAQKGTIYGKVTDEHKLPIIGAIVKISNAGVKQVGAVTDIDGKYKIDSLATGTNYELTVTATGYTQSKITGIKVRSNAATRVDVQLKPDIKMLREVAVISYKKPLIEIGHPHGVLSAHDIKNTGTTNTADLVAVASPGIHRQRPGGDINAFGGRRSATQFIVDGISVHGTASVQDNTYHAKPPAADLSNESYKKEVENDFIDVHKEPLSTMSVDVDRASYSNVRRFIKSGQKPPADAVRVEEMINYFNYDYPQPDDNAPIAIQTKLVNCPWNYEHKLLHIGIQAKKVKEKDLPPSNLVFLIDVSGSMDEDDKLPLLKDALYLLVKKLRDKDRVAIVVYAGNAGLVLPSTSGDDKQKILNAINNLSAGGSTAGGAGIKLAYQVAQENFVEHGNNRVLLATDGDFNVGVSSDAEMETLITSERKKGIFLTCLGFGTGNYKDSKMEIMADKGNGNYDYIDNIEEAQKTLVNEFAGTLFTVAKDVKAQIEFNPANVKAYRLVGYEDRKLNTEDFRNDQKDAGDMGLGHSVTILYEIIPTAAPELKYQPVKSVKGTYSDELATIKFRYKRPEAMTSTEIAHVIPNKTIDLQDAGDTRFAAAVAMFGMKLSGSEHMGDSDYETITGLATNSKGKDENGYRKEFIELVKMEQEYEAKTSLK